MIGFFDDSGLSVQSTGLTAIQATTGASAAVDREVFLSVTDTGRAWYAASDPGVDDIVVSIADSAGGTSLLPSSVRMALLSADLGTATPGASLVIDTAVQPGSINAISFWVRIDAPVFAAGIYSNLSLTTNDLISQAVA